MTETPSYMADAERQAWLTSARAWGAAFPQFAELVALIEARLLDHGGTFKVGGPIAQNPPMAVCASGGAAIQVPFAV